MTDALRTAFRIQSRACADLGSPFMAQLMGLLSRLWWDDTPLAARFAGWSGDIGPSGASLPLRLAGGLHALVLRGDAPALSAVYPPNRTSDEELAEAVRGALFRHTDFLDSWVNSAPQTNEIRRSAVLIAAAATLARWSGLPLKLSELGASAGLNLHFDRYALDLADRRTGPADPVLTLAPDWTGDLPPTGDIAVTDRRGVDLNPLDPASPDDALRLLAFLWPDQAERLERTRRALALPPAPVDRADAADWIGPRLAEPWEGSCHLLYHTVAWQYFPAEVQDRARATIEAAGARATRNAPLAWLSYEADGKVPGAGLTLRLWPGDLRFDLGRADFHGRWVTWTAPALP